MASAADQPAETNGLAVIRRSPLMARSLRGLTHRCAVPSGARVIVGLSGGADSVALACLLNALSRRRSPPIAAPVLVHVHHHLRGAEADADAHSAQQLASVLGLPFLLRDIAPAEREGNLAAAARHLRLAALRSVAEELGASFVAVAHHADDQLETLLMRLARGSGPDGLRGLRWSRRLSDGVRLIRPLLDSRRSELRELLVRAGIPWREDQSNRDPAALRGRLRSDLMNRIQQLWPEAALRATDAATAADIARQLLYRRLRRTFGSAAQQCWPRAALRELDHGLLTAGLRRAAISRHAPGGRRLSFAQLDRAAELIRSNDVHPRQLVWPKGLRVHITVRDVRIDHESPVRRRAHEPKETP